VVARFALPVSILFASASLFAQQPSINTFPNWNGSSFISSFGVVNTATYGQTINVSATTPLNSFSFQISCNAAVNFRGHVYAWNGTMATGPSLFDSGIQSLPGDNVFHQVTFNTPSLSLPAGNYVLFASTSQDQGGAPPSACNWGAITNNSTYPFGQFVFENNGTDTTQWTLTT
jgi:hypothetical protein